MKDSAGRVFAATAALLSLSLPAPAASRGGDSGATPVPAASAPAASPLSVIGRIRATTPLCRTLLDRATNAAGAVLDGDTKLVFLEQTLRATDFDSSQLAKANGDRRLTAEYVALRAGALEGQRQMIALREEAKQAPTPDQQAALQRFADALEGALDRQKKLADQVGRFIAYVDTHEPISADEHDAMLNEAIAQQSIATQRALGRPGPAPDMLTDGDPAQFVGQPISVTAKQAATELGKRAEPIAHDESDAAGRIDAAFAGC